MSEENNKKLTRKKGLKSRLEELKKAPGRKSRAAGLSAKLDSVIQFQDYDQDIEEARRRHLKRMALIGVGAGATTHAGLAGLSLRRLGVKPAWPIATVAGAKGGLIGGAVGLGIGAITRPKRRRIEELSEIFNDLIQFRSRDNEVPQIKSWNPIRRYKEHKALKQWVTERRPSAGITAEQLEKKYPANPKESRAIKIGAAIGAGAGLSAGGVTAALGRGPLKTKLIRGAITGGIATPYTTIIGAAAGGFPYSLKRSKEHKEAWKTLRSEMTGPHTVPIKSIKSPVPTATKYGEVTSELKKQGVGFVPRHATALVTRPLAWTGQNAAFVHRGEKGLIIGPKKISPTIFRHEAGHAKDYAYYGGEQGFKKAYPPTVSGKRSELISNVILPEERAWAYAKPRTKREKDIKEAALTTYRTALGLSALLNGLIEFQEDTRPRNSMGMFTNQQDVGPDPNAMAQTYRRGMQAGVLQGASAGAAGGAGGVLAGQGIKSLITKIRQLRTPKPPLIITP